MAGAGRKFAWVVVGLGFVFAGLQFARPALPNPPVTAEIQAPAEVKEILRNSCYSCHSNETKLAWFDEVVPAYWLVHKDVTQARQHLNFSEIAKLPAAQQRGILFEAVNQIQLGAMPLPQFVKLHPGAAVTPAQLAVLRNYLSTPPVVVGGGDAPAKAVAAATTQYGAWIHRGDSALDAPVTDVQPEFNGVPYTADYKNWKMISSTDRWDNKTMRAILGNDVAIRAIAEKHINPWPDGTAFAKVAWAQTKDDKGMMRAGSFIQVELMYRDGKKYKDSAGWGWGRWRGTDLKPYGKDAGFQNECVSCHLPVKQNDYVYTMPIGGQQ